MPKHELSKLAEIDLEQIADYTTDTWGPAQAERYITSLEECFRMLGLTPGMGRKCDEIINGYRRFQCQKHVVFYKEIPAGTFVIRILHESMLPSQQRFEES